MKRSIPLSILVVGFALAVGSAYAASDGAAVYKASCASCHGEAGAADTPVGAAMKIPPLSGKAAADVSKHLSDAANHAQVNGKLSDEELAAVSAHVAAFE